MLRWVSRSSRRLRLDAIEIAVNRRSSKRRRDDRAGRPVASATTPENPRKSELVDKTRRLPAPDCLHLRNRRGTGAAKRLACAHPLRQSASSRTPTQSIQDSNPNQRFHTALYGDFRVKVYCIDCSPMVEACFDDRGSSLSGASLAPQPCIRLGPCRTRTMKQPFASAARLRGGGPILDSALKP